MCGVGGVASIRRSVSSSLSSVSVMPNPLIQVKSTATSLFGGVLVVRHQPKMALNVAKVIMRWAETEAYVGHVMPDILGSNASHAVSEAVAASNSVRQREILASHAKIQLSDGDMEDLSVVLEMHRITFLERNKVAHWLAGISPQVPNAILFLNPKNQWRLGVAQKVEFEKAMRGQPTPNFAKRHVQATHKATLVYVQSDFDRIFSDIDALTNAYVTLNIALMPRHPAAQESRDRLHSLPQFQQARSRLLAQRTPQ